MESTKLEVPFVKQINKDACGAAVLEMVYKFYGLKDVSQKEIFNQYKREDDEGLGALAIGVVDLVNDALSRGFVSYWNRVDWQDTKRAIEQTRWFVNGGVPIIVCQQSNRDPKLGHFKVLVGYDNENIYLHDPDKENSGVPLKIDNTSFVKAWSKTGKNVTGGVFVFIQPRP